jgi:hypothetical protein
MGFTVFSDLTSPDAGLAVLDALGSDLAPEFIKGIGSSNRALACSSPKDWLTHWAVPAKMSGPGGSRDVVFGADWTRKRAPQGFGMVHHGQLRGEIRPTTITLSHTYSPRVDWLAIFQRLCALLNPAYAMAHLFTPQQVAAGQETGLISSQTGQVFRRHKRPADEFYSTEKRPFFDCELPQLAWANWFGQEWEGRADAVLAAQTTQGPLLTLSDRIEDIATSPEGFTASRARLEPMFAPGIILPRPLER